MYTQNQIEDALINGRQKEAKKLAVEIAEMLNEDRDAAFTAAECGRLYAYPEHIIENKLRISIFMLIQELENRLNGELCYLQIKPVVAYSRKGRLTKKRTIFAKKVPAISFSFQRRGK